MFIYLNINKIKINKRGFIFFVYIIDTVCKNVS